MVIEHVSAPTRLVNVLPDEVALFVVWFDFASVLVQFHCRVGQLVNEKLVPVSQPDHLFELRELFSGELPPADDLG